MFTRQFYLIVFSFCLLEQAKVGAQTYTWTGGGSDTNWGTVGNWNPSTPTGNNNPGAALTDTLVFTAAATPLATVADAGTNSWFLQQLTLNNALSGTGMTLSGSTLDFGAGSGGITAAIGTGTATIVSTINNNIQANKANLQINGAGTGTTVLHRLDFNGSITNSNATGRVTFNSGGTFAAAGNILGAVASPNVSFTGVGTWNIGNAGSSIGTLTTGAATLVLQNGGLGSTQNLAMGVSSGQTARVDLNGRSQVLQQINATGSNAGALVIRNNAASTTSTLTLGNGTSVLGTAFQLLQGAGATMSLAVTGGDHTFTTQNAGNNWSGGISLTGGVLQFAGQRSLGANANALNFSGGTLRYGATTFDISLNGRVVTVGAGGATINTNGQNVVFANSIGNSGAGSLTITGAGSLTLNGGNSYTGGTFVLAGSSLTAGGVGSLSNGDVDINGNGILSLNVLGAINPSASLVLDSASSLNLNFAGTQMIDLFSVDGGATFVPAGIYGAGSFSQLAGIGFIQVTSVPEPSVSLLVLLSLTIGLWRCRFRKVAI